MLRCDRELSHYTNWSLVDELRADQSRSRMAETEVAQPANFAIQVALAAQLEQFGIRPDAVVGHSAGEVAAHYLSGVLTFEQAVQVVFHRSRLQQRASGLGRMLAVGADADSVFHALDDETRDEIGRRVSVAAVNGPSSLTLAGDGDVLDGLARQLDERRIFHRFLPGNVPYHTHHMDPLKDELCSALSTLSPAPATIPLYSTVTGEALDGNLAGAAYWWQNIRATVLFESAIRRLLDDGYTHFVELGPHPVLAASIAETAATQQTDVAVLASARRNEDDIRTLLDCVGELHCHGHRVAWDVLFPPQGARLAKLPVYPWQSRRYWNETQEAAEDLHYEPVHPLLGQPVGGVHSTWEVELSTAIIPFLADHRVQGSVVVPAAVFVEIALAAAEAAYGSTDHRVNDLRLHRALILDETCDPVLRTTLNRQTGAVEFSALTATPASDPKWTLTATAELDTLSSPPGSDDAPSRTRPATTVSSDDFYARTLALGFDYGDAFRLVGSVTSGTGWATAELSIPPQIADDIDGYRFHPALIDGAFQTLFGAASFGDDTVGGPYLPTRVRRSAIYRSPEKAMTAHVRVTSVAADEIESDITITGDDGGLLAAFTGFTVQSLGASLRMSPERVDKSLYEVQWVAATDDPHDTRADADP
ncbi:acyltransferase domain-containing protein, partial [Mycobacterium sp. Lab-001]|uniref:acyltransferase domain-containing protein n=1 Tax=Mycobacterium sp. Lab-001 TaxID=3410136 RepID=UPI003D1671E6